MRLRAAPVPLVLACAAGALLPGRSAAQSVEADFGGEALSRYLWRAIPYASAPTLQPWVSLGVAGFEVGTWGSWTINGSWKEQDLWVAWSGETPAGSTTLTLFEYYYLHADGAFGEWTNWRGVEDGAPAGAHTVEASALVSEPGGAPLSVELATNVHNDPDHAAYVEVGTWRPLGPVEGALNAGLTLNGSDDYGAPGGTLVNVTLALTRTLLDVSGRSVYATGSLVWNPHLGRTLWLLTLGF